MGAAASGLPAPPTPEAAAAAVLNFFPDPALAAPANANRRRLVRQLREALAVALDRPPDAIKLTDRLDDLFPKAGRRAAWGVFKAHFPAWQVPRVRTDTPRWMVMLALVSVLTGLIVGIVETSSAVKVPEFRPRFAWGADRPTLYAVAIVVGLPVAAFLAVFWPPFLLRRLLVRFEFPPGVATVNDLLQHALTAAGDGYAAPAVDRPPVGDVEAVIRERWAEPLAHAVVPDPEDDVPPDEREDHELD